MPHQAISTCTCPAGGGGRSGISSTRRSPRACQSAALILFLPGNATSTCPSCQLPERRSPLRREQQHPVLGRGSARGAPLPVRARLDRKGAELLAVPGVEPPGPPV